MAVVTQPPGYSGPPRLSAKALIVALVLLAAGAYAQRALRLAAWDDYQATQTYEDLYYLPPPGWLGLISLGYRQALADLLWMDALVYFGEELVTGHAAKYVFDYAEAMLALDPDFRAVYRWVGVAAFYRPGGVPPEEGWKGVEFLERAVKRWPDDGELAWDLGATLAFEVPPMLTDLEEREAAKRRGLEHLAVAARLGFGPPWLALTNAKELSKLGRAEQAIRHLEEAYSTVTDPETRQRIANELTQLRTDRYATAFAQAHEQEKRAWEQSYPYFSAPYPGGKHRVSRQGRTVPDLFGLVGAPDRAAYFTMLREGFVPPRQESVLGLDEEQAPGREQAPAAQPADTDEAPPASEDGPADVTPSAEGASDAGNVGPDSPGSG